MSAKFKTWFIVHCYCAKSWWLRVADQLPIIYMYKQRYLEVNII